jgi:hypothetical protein
MTAPRRAPSAISTTTSWPLQVSRAEICRRGRREFSRLLVRFVGRKPSNLARRLRFDAGRGCP